ncbi:PAAR domain-containing protein [Kitasatospora sp. NPDC088346]|uniref:PAAR domain-containing protein n=1 Tax=Kitasatospora sp. NPDC088346 TaxID=3364073 RepID=UPI00381445AD
MPSAARVGDPVGHLSVPTAGGPPSGRVGPPGLRTVLIGGLPAAVVGTVALCDLHPEVPAVILPGALAAAMVLIGGRPAARGGDLLGCGAAVVGSASTVLIGGS